MIPLIQTVGAFFAHTLDVDSVSWPLALAKPVPGLIALRNLDA